MESSGAGSGGVAGYASPFMSGEKLKEKKKVSKLTKLDEQRLKNIIRALIREAKSKDQPVYSSTAINFLKDLIDNIKPKIEAGFKKLASSGKQRKSYVVHLLHHFSNLFDQWKMNSDAAGNDSAPAQDLAEVFLKFKEDGDFFLVNEEQMKDLLSMTEEEDTASETQQQQQQACTKIFAGGEAKPEPSEKGSTEEKAFEKFAIPTEDATGANVAFDVYNETTKPTINTAQKLSDPKDRNEFVNYFYANIVAFCLEFENQMPTPDQALTQFLEQLKQSTQEAAQSQEAPSMQFEGSAQMSEGSNTGSTIDIKSIIAQNDQEYDPNAASPEGQLPATPQTPSKAPARPQVPRPAPRQPQAIPAPQMAQKQAAMKAQPRVPQRIPLKV